MGVGDGNGNGDRRACKVQQPMPVAGDRGGYRAQSSDLLVWGNWGGCIGRRSDLLVLGTGEVARFNSSDLR